MNFIISSCLVGINCRYNGKSQYFSKLKTLIEIGRAISVCPEVLGGLAIPRPCAEIIRISKNKMCVLTKKGEDLTKNFVLGAMKSLEIALANNCTVAILKARSPSCGLGKIYDGSFCNKLIDGNGITSQLFLDHRIKVFTEENMYNIIESIDYDK